MRLTLRRRDLVVFVNLDKALVLKLIDDRLAVLKSRVQLVVVVEFLLSGRNLGKLGQDVCFFVGFGLLGLRDLLSRSPSLA